MTQTSVPIYGAEQDFVAAAIQAVKTAAHQTEVVGGYTVLRTDKNSDTLRCLGEWTNALNRKYAHLTVSYAFKVLHCIHPARVWLVIVLSPLVSCVCDTQRMLVKVCNK